MNKLKQLGSIEFRGVLPMFVEDELIDFLNYYFPNSIYDLDAGMTKTTILFKEQKDWVYKIPHTGIYVPKCKCFDDEPKELYFSLLKENACEKEISFYKQIPTDSLKKYFLPLYPYLETNDITIYRQEKVIILPNYNEKIKIYSCIPNIVLNNLNFDIPHYWLNLAIYKHGIKSVLDLIKFLNNHLSIAQDLSESNLGIDSCGNPVITDYSGFYSVAYKEIFN